MCFNNKRMFKTKLPFGFGGGIGDKIMGVGGAGVGTRTTGA